jgi:hypothetical protein
MAAAEVVGIVYYSALRDRVPCETVRLTLGVIAREERRHLDFQAEWFAQAITRTPRAARSFQAASIALRFGLILGAATVAVLFDHRAVLARLGVRPMDYVRACLHTIGERRHFFYRVWDRSLLKSPA